jgi:hypothetical protein
MKTTTLSPLQTFRAGVYAAFGRQRNAVLEILDALVCQGPVPSLAHLSLAAGHRGSQGRLYAALAHSTFDVAALRQLVSAQPLADGAGLYALDASPWPRPDAVTSAARGFCHHAARHVHGTPVVPGWNDQWLAELRASRDSWTAPVEVVRVPPTDNVNTEAVAQIQRLLAHRRHRRPAAAGSGAPAPPEALVACDAGYDSVQLGVGLAAELAAGQVRLLVRVRANRCFYADPPQSVPGTPGRPRTHGAKFACADPTTWWAPDAQRTTPETLYGTVQVRAWAGVHGIPKQHSGHRRRVPVVRGTLLLVEVERLPRRSHAPKPLWLFWQGIGPAPRDRLWRAYLRRFDLEHPFRFCKQTVNWTVPRLRTPEQADRWSWLVLLAYTQLRLAQAVVAEPPPALAARPAAGAVDARTGAPGVERPVRAPRSARAGAKTPGAAPPVARADDVRPQRHATTWSKSLPAAAEAPSISPFRRPGAHLR